MFSIFLTSVFTFASNRELKNTAYFLGGWGGGWRRNKLFKGILSFNCIRFLSYLFFSFPSISCPGVGLNVTFEPLSCIGFLAGGQGRVK